MGRASPIDDAEACIYGYGAVRFIANAVVSANSNGRRSSMPSNASMKRHKTLSCRLVQHGAIPLMVLHLQMINEAVKFAISFHFMQNVTHRKRNDTREKKYAELVILRSS